MKLFPKLNTSTNKNKGPEHNTGFFVWKLDPGKKEIIPSADQGKEKEKEAKRKRNINIIV